MITYTRKNNGTCSRSTTVNINDEGIIESIEVMGGCDGNLKGISSLVIGMKAEDAIKRMSGITCGPRKSSCPDQISAALQEALDQMTRQA